MEVLAEQLKNQHHARCPGPDIQWVELCIHPVKFQMIPQNSEPSINSYQHFYNFEPQISEAKNSYIIDNHKI
jgi:hypothetical protein